MTTGKKQATSASRDCISCGKKQTNSSDSASKVCKSCQSIVDLLQKNPGLLPKLARLAQISPPSEQEIQKSEEQAMPEVLDAVRYRIADREKNTWYVSVSELDGNPVEIFASTAFENDHHLQSRISNLTTITRLVSLILRHTFLGERITLEKTLTQLKRSSRQPDDLPEMLGKILSNYKKQ